eukprot:TRINITY_DN7229_c0_g1_i1.p1 TRINITY_DN7229_c0_g1~~TRINITY_DN7229_c0_g1_i1.p1  ORF type:complete len:422 (+),score=40.86 TRINITY_DN7229_c0_g1_i1:67-1266(+)
MAILDRNFATKASWLAVWLVAFTIAWRQGSTPNDLQQQYIAEKPPWVGPDRQGQAGSTKLRFSIDGAPDFDPQAHEANRRDGTDQMDPDPWKRKQQTTWKLMILFQHNFPILEQAIAGFERSSAIMVPNMIIIDNSKEQSAAGSAWLRDRVDSVVKTPAQLNFPELHNFMATIALQRRLEFYFWAHSDNYVLSLQPDRDMGKDVIDCLREQIAKHSDWGMVLFAYDHLAAYRTSSLVQVPWDPHVFQYGSECDAYGRIRDAGYEAKACKVHYSYDMKQVLDIRESDTWDEVKTKLDVDQQDRRGRNQWRETQMSAKEQAWRKQMKDYSRKYLASKWGEVKCKLRGQPCSKPWPYCVKPCPADLQFCYNKSITWQQLDQVHARVHVAFAQDTDKPPQLES